MTAAPDAADTELLAEFARTGSETAFTALVERHIGVVHSVALRHTASSQHAQDITQAVFIILAKQADQLPRRVVLAGWLYHAARLTAANFQRTEARRIRREQEAFMQSTLEDPATDRVWSELSPLLDEAMSHLGATDRDALVLRYFQNKTLPEVGFALSLEERAAQKRVARAVEKLRKILSKRGVAISSAGEGGRDHHSGPCVESAPPLVSFCFGYQSHSAENSGEPNLSPIGGGGQELAMQSTSHFPVLTAQRFFVFFRRFVVNLAA